MDLKEIYENKTGKDPWFENELTGTYGLTQVYVEWLEEQLTIGGVMHPLPDANKLYKMAETIVSKQVVIYNTPENKQIDWEELKNDWFDWLNEEIKGNCA